VSDDDTHWTLQHPDAILAICGVLAGTGLGASAGGLGGAVMGAFAGGLLSLFLAGVRPRDPKYGPHQ
jgi:hypothetical protein